VQAVAIEVSLSLFCRLSATFTEPSGARGVSTSMPQPRRRHRRGALLLHRADGRSATGRRLPLFFEHRAVRGQPLREIPDVRKARVP